MNRDGSSSVIALIGVHIDAPAFDDSLRGVDNIAEFSFVSMDSGSVEST